MPVNRPCIRMQSRRLVKINNELKRLPENMRTLNEVFTKLSMRRRYEVWFLRLGLGDGSGAWWFRYLLMNPGRGGCPSDPLGRPMQVWATWFPREGKPETWIQGFPVESLRSNGTVSNDRVSSNASSRSAVTREA